MADDLSNLWANLSLSEGEDGELEIQMTEVNEILIILYRRKTPV
jgi:hypothetical protein